MRLWPPMAEQPLPGSRLLHASPCRRNKRNACAEGDCRLSTPYCAVVARRRPGSRSREPDNAPRPPGDKQDRYCAPVRRCADRRRVSSTWLSGSREMSISALGRSTSIFIRSIRLVPPAMNFAVGSRRSSVPLRRRLLARAYWKSIMTAPSPAGLPRRCWCRRRSGRCCRSSVRGFRPRSSPGLPRSAQPRADLAGRAISALEGVMIDERLLQRMQRPSSPGPRWW